MNTTCCNDIYDIYEIIAALMEKDTKTYEFHTYSS